MLRKYGDGPSPLLLIGLDNINEKFKNGERPSPFFVREMVGGRGGCVSRCVHHT